LLKALLASQAVSQPASHACREMEHLINKFYAFIFYFHDADQTVTT